MVEIVDAVDLRLNVLKLDLIDLVSDYTNAGTGYIPYMGMYTEELKALLGLPVEEQKKRLEDIAHRVIASHDNGGFKIDR